jgi:hypothetical protein
MKEEAIKFHTKLTTEKSIALYRKIVLDTLAVYVKVCFTPPLSLRYNAINLTLVRSCLVKTLYAYS